MDDEFRVPSSVRTPQLSDQVVCLPLGSDNRVSTVYMSNQVSAVNNRVYKIFHDKRYPNRHLDLSILKDNINVDKSFV